MCVDFLYDRCGNGFSGVKMFWMIVVIVLACILSAFGQSTIETETSASVLSPYADSAFGQSTIGKKASKNTVRMAAKNDMRIMNESIQILNTSKNLETVINHYDDHIKAVSRIAG
jgi:hypothetical protein